MVQVEDVWVEFRVVRRKVREFIDDESGATAIEYGLIAALIAVVVIVALKSLGNNVKNVFNNVAANVK